MKIVSIVNHKGGCGKTTTAINLGASLACHNRRILMVDMDPQGHLGLGLGIDPQKSSLGTYDVLSEPNPTPAIMRKATIEFTDKFSIIPSGISLSTLEQRLSTENKRELRLDSALLTMSDSFDYVIIDCPPNLGLLTFNALVAATDVIIPLEMSFFSLHGMTRLKEIIDLVVEKKNRQIETHILGVMFDRRTRIAKEVLEDIRENFQQLIFDTVINTNVKLKEAASFGKSIIRYDKSCQGFRDYLALAVEFAERKGDNLDKFDDDFESGNIADKTFKTVFSYFAPNASSIRVVGSFNNWSPSITSAMKRLADGTWTTTLELPAGTHQYKFIVDNSWVEDCNNPNAIESPLGGKNSVIHVGQ